MEQWNPLNVSIHTTYFGGIDTANVTFGLLATVGAATLAIPGIETTHWLARAFLMGSMLLAICSIIICVMMSGVFDNIFGEEMHPPEGRQHLTLKTDSVLLHKVDVLFDMPFSGITNSALLFIGGVVVFVVTVDFGAAPVQMQDKVKFTIVTLAPSVLFFAWFCYSFGLCYIRNRRFCNRVS